MILIIEGSNKAGKSTLINELKKFHGVHARNSRILNNDTNKDFCSSINMELMNARMEAEVQMLEDLEDLISEDVLIFDRFHLTEYVYGFKFRGYTNTKMIEFDKRLADLNAKLILMRSDYEHIENPTEAAQYIDIQNKMGSIYDLSVMNKSVYKAETQKDFRDIAKEIIRGL